MIFQIHKSSEPSTSVTTAKVLTMFVTLGSAGLDSC